MALKHIVYVPGNLDLDYLATIGNSGHTDHPIPVYVDQVKLSG